MLDKDKAVQGVGVYAEFRRGGSVMQMLITPDAYTTAGTLVPMSFVRRIATTITPKKQWKVSPLSSDELKSYVDSGNALSDSDKDTFAEMRLRRIMHHFDLIIDQGWEIQKKPFLVEMSRFAADDVAKSKTPNKMLYRVKISREALGFAEVA
jgi:hypothetical protein